MGWDESMELGNAAWDRDLIQKTKHFWGTIFSASLRLSFLIWEMGGKQPDRAAMRIKSNNTCEVLQHNAWEVKGCLIPVS